VAAKFEKRGIGKALVRAAEDFVLRWASQHHPSTVEVFMEMTVINVRSDLIVWYERQGYQITGETSQLDEKMVAPGFTVWLELMRKHLK
jgi:GNAT superfamily N-acetyltransferase